MKLSDLKANRKPSLRFPGYSKDWERAYLGTFFKYRATNSLSREDLNFGCGDVINIHYGDIHTKYRSTFDAARETVPFINCGISTARTRENDYCRVGDLVMADASEDYSDVGKTIEIVNLDGKWAVAGLHTILLRQNRKAFATSFLAPLMQSWKVRLQIMTYSQGTKVYGILKDWLSRIELDFPEIEEQQKIAAFLSVVDERIGQLARKKELLLKYKKGVMQQIFSQKIRFKDDNGNDFPNWEEKRLAEVASRVTRKNSINNKNVLTISAQHGLISQLEFFNRSVAASDVTGYYLLEKDEFAYNKSYSKGYPMGAIKRLRNYDLGIVSTLYICFKPSDKINSDFLEHYFEFGGHNHEIAKVAQEGARNHGLLNIGIDDFFGIKLAVPSVPEQKQIAKFLSALDHKIQLASHQLERTKTFKKGLLQQMFV